MINRGLKSRTSFQPFIIVFTPGRLPKSQKALLEKLLKRLTILEHLVVDALLNPWLLELGLESMGCQN